MAEAVSKSRFVNSSRNIFFSLLSQALTLLFDIICRKVFLQVLSAEYLGLTSTFSSVLNILSFAELGVGTAIIYSLYKPIKENDQVKITALLRLYRNVYWGVGAFILIAGACLTPVLSSFVKEMPNIPHVNIIYLLLVFQVGSQYFFSYKINFLNATQQNYVFRIVQISASLIKLVLQIASLLIFKNYFLYLAIAIVITLAVDIYCSIYVNKKYPFLKNKPTKLDKEEYKTISKNIFALFLYRVSNTISVTIDTIIISKMLGVVPAAIYANYHLIITYSDAFFINGLGNITPSVGNLMVDSTIEKKKSFFKTMQDIYYWISTYLGVGMIICFNPMVQSWLGTEFLLEESVVIALAISVTLTNFQRPCSIMRDANGLFWYGKLRPLFMAIINVALSILLTYYFGIIGVVIGTIASKVLTFVWYDPYIVYKHVLKKGLKEYYLTYIERWLFFLVLTVTCYALCYRLHFHGWAQLITYAAIVTIVVNISSYLYYKNTPGFAYLKERFSNIKKLFKKQPI